MTICLTKDRYTAVYHHFFTVQKRSLEGAPGPGVDITFMPDTTPKVGQWTQKRYFLAGPWGKGMGSDWPDRVMVKDREDG